MTAKAGFHALLAGALQLIENGDSRKDAAEKAGVSGTALWSYLKRERPDLVSDRQSAMAASRRAVELVANGTPVEQAAKEVGIGATTLWTQLKKERPALVKRRGRGPARSSPAATSACPTRPARPNGIDVTLKDGRGIDVSKCFQDIRRIVLGHFNVAGVHPDDLVQEVALRVHEQNALPCAFDPARSSFSHYVYMVASNVAARAARSLKKECNKAQAARVMQQHFAEEGQNYMQTGLSIGIDQAGMFARAQAKAAERYSQ